MAKNQKQKFRFQTLRKKLKDFCQKVKLRGCRHFCVIHTNGPFSIHFILTQKTKFCDFSHLARKKHKIWGTFRHLSINFKLFSIIKPRVLSNFKRHMEKRKHMSKENFYTMVEFCLGLLWFLKLRQLFLHK